ncbi:unnamed protein product, partial [Iphiclides podalirius]
MRQLVKERRLTFAPFPARLIELQLALFAKDFDADPFALSACRAVPLSGAAAHSTSTFLWIMTVKRHGDTIGEAGGEGQRLCSSSTLLRGERASGARGDRVGGIIAPEEAPYPAPDKRSASSDFRLRRTAPTKPNAGPGALDC